MFLWVLQFFLTYSTHKKNIFLALPFSGNQLLVKRCSWLQKQQARGSNISLIMSTQSLSAKHCNAQDQSNVVHIRNDGLLRFQCQKTCGMAIGFNGRTLPYHAQNKFKPQDQPLPSLKGDPVISSAKICNYKQIKMQL